MRFRARLLPALVLWGQLASPHAAGDPAIRLERFLEDLKSFSAEFSQEVLDEEGALLERSSGTFLLLRPGRFSWEYLEPYRQRIVSNGDKLWLYDEDLIQVTVHPVQGRLAGSAAELLGGENVLGKAYTVRVLDPRDGVEWFELRPRDEAAQYTRLEIGLDASGLAGMRLMDNLGQTTVLGFRDRVMNPSLLPGQFEFRVPPGVDVVEGGGAAP